MADFAEHGPMPDVDPDRCDPQLLMAHLERFPHNAAPRVPALLAACRRYGVDPYRQAEAGDVDVWLVVTGDIPAPQYLAITSHGGDDRRASLHHTLDYAQAHAASGVHEPLWTVWPVAVIETSTPARSGRPAAPWRGRRATRRRKARAAAPARTEPRPGSHASRAWSAGSAPHRAGPRPEEVKRNGP